MFNCDNTFQQSAGIQADCRKQEQTGFLWEACGPDIRVKRQEGSDRCEESLQGRLSVVSWDFEAT